MAETVALVDYGAGNLHSVANALKAAGAQGVRVTADPMVVRAADRIVLPGVGSFRACAEGLRAIDGLVEAMDERVRIGGAPFLGICVGMQLLASRGLEHGETAGLDWIGGEVRAIESDRSGDQSAAYGLERCERHAACRWRSADRAGRGLFPAQLPFRPR